MYIWCISSVVEFRDRVKQTVNQSTARAVLHVSPQDVDHAVIVAQVCIWLSSWFYIYMHRVFTKPYCVMCLF